MELRNEGERRKRRNSSPPSQNPELSEEIIFEEILVRLPVKSLVRFKSVCKAWRAAISDPIFIRAQLRHSTAKQEQDPCLLISPFTLDNVIPGESGPRTFSNQCSFYQWHHRQCNGGGTASSKQTATLMYAKDLGDGEVISHVGYLAFCDGLVLVRTDTKLYLFNPAIRETLTLPGSKRNNLVQEACNSAGLGLDPRSGKYKVVRAFYRSVDIVANAYRMGMEVFTVGGGRRSWRRTAHDPPYPVSRRQTSLTVKGLMFWHIDKARYGHHQTPPRGLLHLNLADESFGLTGLPESMDPALDNAFIMDMLRGELWLTARTSRTPDTMTVWAMPVVDGNGGQGQWEQRYSIIGYPLLFRPLAVLPGTGSGGGGSSRVLFCHQRDLYSYDPATSMMTMVCEMERMRYQGRTARKWKNLFKFNVRLYAESLVPLTA